MCISMLSYNTLVTTLLFDKLEFKHLNYQRAITRCLEIIRNKFPISIKSTLFRNSNNSIMYTHFYSKFEYTDHSMMNLFIK